MNQDAKIVFLMLAVLLMLGIVMIYSSSAVYADGEYGNSMFFVKKHLVYLAAGIAAAILCMVLPAGKIQSSAKVILGVSILLLLAVLIPGVSHQVKGARRWMRFFGMGIQPSELAKIAVIIYLSDFIARKRHFIKNLKYGFVPPLFVLGLVAGLVIIEPDMGTSVSILVIGLTMLFTAGAGFRHMLIVCAGMIPVLAMAVILAPYRMRRMLVFFDPWKDAKGSGFQLIQSFIALGSGGVLGVGLGASRQKLFYLPESHTDFIFSIIGEELGFLGAASVLLLFSLMIWFAFRLSFRIKDVFASSVVVGVTIMIAFEVVVNVGVSTGVLPTKGLPLPFISYGGSSLVCHLAAMGLVFNMARKAE